MASGEALSAGWHSDWEQNVYRRGKQLNRYPHQAVVGFLFKQHSNPNARSKIQVLELGFGAGNNLWFAAREGFSVAGIEGSEAGVEFAKRRFADEDLCGDLRVGDFASLPWPDDSFDVAIDRFALTHNDRGTIERALNETLRVLKPGGKMISMIFSDEHPARYLGRHLGDNTYTDFTHGYFFGLGAAHCFPRQEVDDCFGSRFLIHRLTRNQERDELTGETLTAYWHLECEKPV